MAVTSGSKGDHIRDRAYLRLCFEMQETVERKQKYKDSKFSSSRDVIDHRGRVSSLLCFTPP